MTESKIVSPPTRREMKKALGKKTMCGLHHGWPCGTCFYAISKKLTNKDLQALLLFRGDYKKEDLNNLPKDINKSLVKIYDLAK